MFDLKVINSVLQQLEDERGIPKEKIIDAIETALATAYKKEYGKRGQIVRAKFNVDTGAAEFFQVKIIVDETQVKIREITENEEKDEAPKEGEEAEDDRVYFNPEHHIFLEDAQKIRKDVIVGEEIVFPLEPHDNYGRIAAQTAKQVIIQKIREAEKVSVFEEFSKREHEIINGTVQRAERGNLFVDLGRTTGILPYDEQIPGERYKTGERIRAYLYSVEETPRGIFLRLSRSHPQFLQKLFEIEAPEIASGVVEVKSIAREAGSRSKIAVLSHDEHIDPVGSLVGQRGVRVSTVMSELGGEKIDIIEWSATPAQFVEDALSPAKVLSVEIDENEKRAVVEVSEDQQSLAIGKGGQNVRLAAKLTGWKIDIRSVHGKGGGKKKVHDDEALEDDSSTGAAEHTGGGLAAAVEEALESAAEEKKESKSE
ncbi:MAG: N utilization substance protein A [Parcubacteria group bacterium Gr01-1014_48]|nr:MAG: N utilization substance protein A [Parcubacteria group bacterium Greene0416_14]TSC73490.1 MAG: N utilization substance protein A [Parcubacteria group bacterium Gr01-1014_48]TSD01223.1 MAG: N utilization substance protein A [Parcubacteria group bacterium Greene1014_15]TSD08312.1 MAG: N utilization substance protein A [Parcubacteria group bacterium Greene0714_4]